MKIALVYAGIARIGWNSFNKFGPEDEESFFIPAGLMYIKAILQEDGSHEVDTLDLRMLEGPEEYEQKLVEGRYGLVCMSFLSPSRDYGVLAAKLAKQHGMTTIAGGIHASALPEDLVETGYFDSVVVGEGEKSIFEILSILEKGEPLPRIYHTRNYVQALDELPFPATAYLPVYKTAFGVNRRMGHIVAGRGCPARCRFCYDKRLLHGSNGLRVRSPKSVVEEMLYLKRNFGVELVGFADDTFAWSKRWLRAFLQEVKSTKTPLPQIAINTRANMFDEERAGMLKDVGCVAIWFGFESGSDRILDIVKKGATVKQNLRAARICKEFGFDLNVNILVGVPGETEEDYLLTYRFLEQIEPTRVRYNVLTPYPGSDFYNELVPSGLVEPRIFEETVLQYAAAHGGVIKSVDYSLVNKWQGPFSAFDTIGKLKKLGSLWSEKERQLDAAMESLGLSRWSADRIFSWALSLMQMRMIRAPLKYLIFAMQRLSRMLK